MYQIYGYQQFQIFGYYSIKSVATNSARFEATADLWLPTVSDLWLLQYQIYGYQQYLIYDCYNAISVAATVPYQWLPAVCGYQQYVATSSMRLQAVCGYQQYVATCNNWCGSRKMEPKENTIQETWLQICKLFFLCSLDLVAEFFIYTHRS